jgi:hypothetical protein
LAKRTAQFASHKTAAHEAKGFRYEAKNAFQDNSSTGTPDPGGQELISPFERVEIDVERQPVRLSSNMMRISALAACAVETQIVKQTYKADKSRNTRKLNAEMRL